MELYDPATPDAVVTNVTDRDGCLFVTGRVCKRGEWLSAAFTISKGDLRAEMTRGEFRAMAKRRLPDFAEDVMREYANT